MSEPVEEKKINPSNSKTNLSSTLNVNAPEFVPRTQTQIPNSGYPNFQYIGTTSGSDRFNPREHNSVQLISNSTHTIPISSKSFLSDDLRLKIVKQVEYQFSDMSLFASDIIMKHIIKDPEGYVPLSVISSLKKIKTLVSNNQLLVQALRTSSTLVVSDDGKKIKRKHLFTERDREDMQSRTIVAENLPEDYTHQNIEKIFGVVGSVKNIRICHPQESNASRPKGDLRISNKLHALVEYESAVQAEKAVEELNDERNWRKGLHVRLLLRRLPRSVTKIGTEDDEVRSPLSVDDESTQPKKVEIATENNIEDNSTGIKKGRGRVRGNGRARSKNHSGLGVNAPNPQSDMAMNKQTPPPGPRMPDGTRGFAIGRGKPLSLQAATNLQQE